jgi:hypothetical protein
MKVPAERLRSTLGITNVQYVVKKHSLAVVDSPLAAAETTTSGLLNESAGRRQA